MVKAVGLLVLPLILALMLDLLLGDPAWLYHPIRLVGSAIYLLERLLRRIFSKTKSGELVAGIVLAVFVPVLFFTLSLLLLLLAYRIHFSVYFILETFLTYQLLAARSLKTESGKVKTALEKNDLADARLKLSYIVGRDTDQLGEQDIIRATIETISENANDGVISPIFYHALGGAPLCFYYKAVNTLDSMVGYKNDRYQHFGTASAIWDDVLGFIPARISGYLMIFSCWLVGLDRRGAYKIYRRDRWNHASPNSACTEAATAGALGIQLGGGGYYGGRWQEKPTIGDDLRPPELADIDNANRLMQTSAVVGALLFSAIKLLILYLIFSGGYL